MPMAANMPNYNQWNTAIAQFFSAGLQTGSFFYLGIDEDTLAEIGVKHIDCSPDVDCTADFLNAVRARCVRSQRVSLPGLTLGPTDGPPNCVAFLASMVLAAQRMDSDDAAAENNYFVRLREVLGLTTDESGRPPGLVPPAPEERLWTVFNEWVRSNGWLPTAERGETAPGRYINYPISQALLRQGDRARLKDVLMSKGDRSLDLEQIGSWFQRATEDMPTTYLRALTEEAASAASGRFEAIADAVHEVYSEIDWSQSPLGIQSGVRSRTPRRLTAGLYRDSDPIWENVDYYLYPRRPNRLDATNLHVSNGPKTERLREERVGRFRPLSWTVDPSGGDSYRVSGSSEISELIMPRRDFWILLCDPYDESSGVYASWGTPSLGIPFLLLCKNELHSQLSILQRSELLTWDSRVELTGKYAGWAEYRECRIASADCLGTYPGVSQSLIDELRPRTRASISLQGGLKAGGRRDEWIVDHLPTLIVTSSVVPTVRITAVAEPNNPIMEMEVSSSEPIELPTAGPSEYYIEVLISSKRAAKRVYKTVNWDSLEMADPPRELGVQFGRYTLRGGALEEGDSYFTE